MTLPSGWVFIVACVLLRLIEGIGSAMFTTAMFSLLQQLYPDNVGLMMVNCWKIKHSHKLLLWSVLSVLTMQIWSLCISYTGIGGSWIRPRLLDRTYNGWIVIYSYVYSSPLPTYVHAHMCIPLLFTLTLCGDGRMKNIIIIWSEVVNSLIPIGWWVHSPISGCGWNVPSLHSTDLSASSSCK